MLSMMVFHVLGLYRVCAEYDTSAFTTSGKKMTLQYYSIYMDKEILSIYVERS